MTQQTDSKPNLLTILLYCAFSLALTASTWLASQHLPPRASIYYGENGFGAATQSLVEQHRWGFIDTADNLWCYACRTPFIPFLQAASALISPRIVTFVVLKNLLFWPLWLYALLRLKRHYCIPDHWAFVAVALLLLAPYNLNIAGWVDVEEGFLFPLIALAFSLLLTIEGTGAALAAGVTLVAIYLTKSSMFPLCLVACVWLVFRYWRQWRLMSIPIACVALAIIGWGLSIRAASGVFAFGSDTSSWNGWNFYKGNNPWAYPLYPRVSLDTLDDEKETHGLLPFGPIQSEWQLSHEQFQMARAYMQQNPTAILQMDVKKLFVACCDLRESPEKTAGHTRPSIIFSNLISHATLLCVVALAVTNLYRRRATQAEILALLLTAAYVAPYFAGFLYMRHMVPIYGLMNFTLAIQLTHRHKTVPARGDCGPPAERYT